MQGTDPKDQIKIFATVTIPDGLPVEPETTDALTDATPAERAKLKENE